MSMIHHHQLGDACNADCRLQTAEERRIAERRKPTVDKPYREGLAYVLERKFTGSFTVHASEGVPKRIVLPNPEGW
jgi:hypothetical protein